MRDKKRVVLAYSGGVDTTACIPYLRHQMGCEHIVAMAADLGQGGRALRFAAEGDRGRGRRVDRLGRTREIRC